MTQVFKNPASTVDLIVEKQVKKNMRHDGKWIYERAVLCVKRKNPPFQGMWALPGGYLEYGKETLEQAASRELKEETNLDVERLRLFGVYSDPNRDPRGHVISHVYIPERYNGIAKAGDDAKEFGWFPLSSLPELAFDHSKILEDYKKMLDKQAELAGLEKYTEIEGNIGWEEHCRRMQELHDNLWRKISK